MGASESTAEYQELVEGQFSSSCVIENDSDNWRSLPPDAVHNILYHLDVQDLGKFMQTSKYNLSLVSRTSSFWINLAQEKYWSDLGALEETSEKSPLFYKKKFQALVDIKFPIRVTRRVQRENALTEGRSKVFVDLWYYLGLAPFWEAVFFFSLFAFFVFLPVYLDKMIPGMETIHIMLFLIVPFLQVVWNTLLSLPAQLWTDFRTTWFDSRIPPGSLFVSILPYYISKEDDNVFYFVVSGGVGGFMLWVGLLILNSLQIIHYWIASFAVLWLLYFIPMAVIVVAIYNENNAKGFDLFYFSLIGLGFGIWLIFLPLHIDGFVDWNMAYIFLPLFVAEGLLVVLPLIAAFFACCDLDVSDLAGDTCCALMAIAWPPVLIFGAMEALIILLVEYNWGYWTCAFIPIYLSMALLSVSDKPVLCGGCLVWMVLYGESMGNARRPAYFIDFMRRT